MWEWARGQIYIISFVTQKQRSAFCERLRMLLSAMPAWTASKSKLTRSFWDDTIITKKEKRQNQPDHSSIILKRRNHQCQ